MNSNTVTSNPVTATAALGLVVQGVLAIMKVDPEVQASAAQITLGVAVLVRLGVAWWDGRRKRLAGEEGEVTIGQVLIVAGVLLALAASVGLKVFTPLTAVVIVAVAVILVGIGALKG